MALLDLEKVSFKDIQDSIKEVYKNYSNYKDYKLFSHYHYINNKQVGVVYGWFKENYLNIDIIYVCDEYRKQGIALQMIKAVINKIHNKKDIDYIIIELVKYHNKYLLFNTLINLNFKLSLNYVFNNRCIFYKNLTEV